MRGLTARKNKEQSKLKKSTRKPQRLRVFRLHPLFIAVGVWYAFTGDLFLFLLSALVAVQHECAHAFAAAKLGYKLNAVVLMPFGAIIDGDLRGISLKDEIFVALCGPLCNLITAACFAALWWIYPTTYPFTDTACYTSLAIALVNLLPAYPLDGGRICKCALTRFFSRSDAQTRRAERRAERFCRCLTMGFAALFFCLFFRQLLHHQPNYTALLFGIFLAVGALGNRDKSAVYERLDFSSKNALRRGVEIKRVALCGDRPIKDAFRFLSRGSYLIVSVYDEDETHLFDVAQNELSSYFLSAKSPYTPLSRIHKNNENYDKNTQKMDFS